MSSKKEKIARVKVIAWDFDGVLTRNIVNGRFVWADTFEADIGQSRKVFEDYVFGRNLEAILTGKEDLRERVGAWAKSVGYAPGPDALLDYWFTKDARRTTYIESNLGFGNRVERIFASGRMGVAKPDVEYFKAVSATLNVHPNEIFFIDDSAANIIAAQRLGWQTMHFTDETRDTLEALLPAVAAKPSTGRTN